MKNYITSIMIVLSGFYYGQVTIEKTDASGAPANGSVSVEFGNPTGGVKGIVLPWVSTESGVTTTSPLPGTMIFDSGTQKLKYATASTPNATAITGWVDLSAGAFTPATFSQPDSNVELANAKAVIGSNAGSNSTSGILVLGDANKAMILPRVASHTSIINPAAGMMVFVTSTSQLAFYNGREWSFWTKP